MQPTPYLVGGAVRDQIMGRTSNDRDYVVEADSYEDMRAWIEDQGKIWQERPEFQTIRAKVNGEDADFVLARKDGPYEPGQRFPSYTERGTLFDDLARRDFTMNAIALRGADYIDPHGGMQDIGRKMIRAVGDPRERMMEDPLRALRALRFKITLGFNIDPQLSWVMNTVAVMKELEDSVPADRFLKELMKMFKHDSWASTRLLTNEYATIGGVVRRKGFWLKPTLEKR